MTWKLLTICFIAAVYILTRLLTHHRRRASYPPGPRGLPFLGNLLQLSLDLWVPLSAWKKEFGPIVHLDVAGQSIIVLNTLEAATDVLDRRAANFSNRPRNIVASDMLSGGLLFVFTRYGDTWRRMRRAAHKELNKAESVKFQPVQAAESVILTHDLITKPEKWDNHLRRTAASSIMSTVYDLPTLTSEDDPSIRRINDFVERLVRSALPGAHLVEFFTWMRYLPSWMAPWKKNAMDWYRKDSIMFEGMYSDVIRRMSEGDERSSFCSMIAGTDQYNLSIRESAWLAATLFAAGAETTSAVMAWFVTAMAAYPDVQKRAHEELDAVVGRSRMPTFADYPNLRYIRAIVKECLRWHPVDPVGKVTQVVDLYRISSIIMQGLPHRSMEDDWYNGHLIPGDSVVIANVWAINRNPDIYGEDAEHFNPARFLNEDGSFKPSIPDTTDDDHVSYGFGRRKCVGRHMANNSLFIGIANILWAVNIAPPDGCCPDVDRTVNMGLVVRPVLIDYTFTPRFADAESIVSQTRDLVKHSTR